MPGNYRIFPSENYPYFVTCTIVQWTAILTVQPFLEIILDSLNYLHEHKGVTFHAFVIMPSHLHAVMRTEPDGNLSGILRDFKRFTSRSISQEAERCNNTQLLEIFAASRQAGRNQKVSQYQVWQDGNHPEVIYTKDFGKQKVNYLHENPVRAGFVSLIQDYPYSSARAYLFGDEACVPVEPIEL